VFMTCTLDTVLFTQERLLVFIIFSSVQVILWHCNVFVTGTIGNSMVIFVYNTCGVFYQNPVTNSLY